MQFSDLLAKAKESGALGGGVIPEGEYDLEASIVNVKTVKSGPSLSVLWKVLDRGPLENSTGWQNFYFSDKAIGISMRSLNTILGEDGVAAAAGDLELADALEALAVALKGRKSHAKVGIEEGKDGYDDKNKFRHVAAVDSLKAEAAPATAGPDTAGIGF